MTRKAALWIRRARILRNCATRRTSTALKPSQFIEENKSRPFFYYATPLVHGSLAVKELGEFKDKPAAWSPAHKAVGGGVRELDQSVGLIVAEVKKLGLATNTLILFASDNGYAEWGYLRPRAMDGRPALPQQGAVEPRQIRQRQRRRHRALHRL